MIPVNPLENQNAVKTLYAKCIGEICNRWEITRMELDILLLLANNPCFDTAKDIIEIRYLSKSQTSVSIKLLEKRGYIKKEYATGNRKTAHLKLCEAAAEIIKEGKAAQERFLTLLFHGFTTEELHNMKQYSDRVRDNIHRFLKEKMK